MEDTVLAVTKISWILGKEGVNEGANGEDDKRLTTREIESLLKEDTEQNATVAKRIKKMELDR